MPQLIEISPGLVIRQQQQGFPVIVPNSSVNMNHLSPATIQALQPSDVVVGNLADVEYGFAQHESILAAITANPLGCHIFIREGYSLVEDIILQDNYSIEGAGEGTTLGSITITGFYNVVKSLRHGDLTVSGDMNLIQGTWTTGTVVNTGSLNEIQYING
jgi:hypothetical protein